MQKIFSPTPDQITNARAFLAAVAEISGRMRATDHEMERAALVAELAALVRPGGNNALVNLAHEIVDAQIAEAIAEFIALTGKFFNAEDRSRKAAEETDLLRTLHIHRSSFDETASADLAQRLADLLRSVAESVTPNE